MGNKRTRSLGRRRTKRTKSAKLRALKRKMGLFNKNSLPCEFLDVGNFIQSHTMDRHDMNKLTRNETSYDTTPSFNSSLQLEMCDTVVMKTEMLESTESEITEYSVKKERIYQISNLSDIIIEGINENEPIKAEIKEETIEMLSKENNANEVKGTKIDSTDVCCILCLNKTNVKERRVLKDVQNFRDDIFKFTGRDINVFLGMCPLKACNHCIADLKKIKEVRTIMIKSQIKLQKLMYKEYTVSKTNYNIFDIIDENDENGVRPMAEIFETSLQSIRESNIESTSFADRLSYNDSSYPHITQCVICDSSFDRSELLYYHHVIVHRGASCQCCGGKFKSLQSYLKHIYDTTANGENGGDDNFKWKKCEDCSLSVVKYFMHFHKLQHEYEEAIDKERLSSSLKNRQNDKNNKLGEKNKDDGEETNADEMIDNETSDDDEINENKTSDDDEEDLNKKNFERSVCTYCDQLVRTDIYKSHLATHVVLQCELCGMLIPKRYIAKHQFEQHIDVSAICEVCGKDVRGVRNLVNHMRVHTGEKPFECKYCDRTFSLIQNKVAHERLHTNARPYKCTKCDKAYNHNVSLKKHVITSH